MAAPGALPPLPKQPRPAAVYERPLQTLQAQSHGPIVFPALGAYLVSTWVTNPWVHAELVTSAR